MPATTAAVPRNAELIEHVLGELAAMRPGGSDGEFLLYQIDVPELVIDLRRNDVPAELGVFLDDLIRRARNARNRLKDSNRPRRGRPRTKAAANGSTVLPNEDLTVARTAREKQLNFLMEFVAGLGLIEDFRRGHCVTVRLCELKIEIDMNGDIGQQLSAGFDQLAMRMVELRKKVNEARRMARIPKPMDGSDELSDGEIDS